MLDNTEKLASQIRSAESDCPLDCKALAMKTGLKLMPLQNTVINDADAFRNNINTIVSVFVIDYRQIKLNAI